MIGVVLAGGQGRRMGGRDKGALELDGRRLVDRVVEALAAQVDAIMLAAPHDYGLGLPLVVDHPALQGPAAGIVGAAAHLDAAAEPMQTFLAVPVDAPSLPIDLLARLEAASGSRSAHAADDGGAHPTFALWAIRDVLAAREALPPAPSLKALAAAVGSVPVQWPGEGAFANINTPDDLDAARAQNRAHPR